MDDDLGVPEVGQYLLQVLETRSSGTNLGWQILETIPATQTPDSESGLYEFSYTNLDETRTYSYRVVTNRTEFGKLVSGGISPRSTAVRPACPSK